MTQQLGYEQTANIGGAQAGAIGGPMNIGEEYRWNLPEITYGFDASFVTYFGSNGMAAVEEAVAILNALPAASSMNLESFPEGTIGINYVAQTLYLIDLKSATLSLLLEHLGLANAERHTYGLRARAASESQTNYTVIMRNFDPFTWRPTRFVNGTLYGYEILEFANPLVAEAYEYPVDPLAFYFTSLPGRPLARGEFYTGLSRDEAGGLSYLLSPDNWNTETLVQGTRAAGEDPDNFVNRALRPGVDKISFRRVHFDSGVGDFQPFTQQFVDRYVSNYIVLEQLLEREVTTPDILFAARDLPDLRGGIEPPVFARTGTSNWVNHGQPASGPGVIHPPVSVIFNTTQPVYYNQTPYYLIGVTAFPGVLLGSFNATTNAALAYPIGREIRMTRVRLRLYQGGDSRDYEWKLTGAFNYSQFLQSSSNLRSWQTITTVTNTGMTQTFDEFIHPDVPARFFRLSSIP